MFTDVDADSPSLSMETYVGVDDFCHRIFPELVSVFGLYTGSPEVGEDVAQEVLARVWGSWGKVSTLQSPRSWAFRVGFNLANSWWR
ncbi:MAG: RNA polymerase sigma factor, partial [Chloroflexota bacterium]